MKTPLTNYFVLLLVFGLLSACSQALTIEDRNNTDKFDLGISGQITDAQGEPAAGTYVYAYRNIRSNLRGPADFEAQVGEDGLYFLDLVEGDYYLVARMRQTGADAGPPKPGDAWALPAANPVTVKPGEVTTVNFVLQGISQPMLMREGTLTSGDTGFTGLLIDVDGQPLAGAFVIAYPEANFQRMPETTSPAAGKDGRFHLYVERTGQWCQAARTRTRGQPIAGEPYGLLGIKESGCRNAVSGQLIDVGTIRLTPYRQ
jgi:hypothetical protein